MGKDGREQDGKGDDGRRSGEEGMRKREWEFKEGNGGIERDGEEEGMCTSKKKSSLRLCTVYCTVRAYCTQVSFQ